MQNYMVLWSVLLPNCEILFRTIPGFRLQSVWLAKLWTILRTASLSDLAPSSLLSVMDSLLISLHLPNTVILQRYVLHSYSICTSVTWPYYYRSTHFLVNLLLFLAVKCKTKILPIRFAALSTYCVILSTDCPSVKWWSTNCVCLSTSASMAWPHCTLWRCANQFPMSLVVAVYVPQPAVIWLSREPKRQHTDHTVFQCRGQQAGTHYLNRSVTQPRHSDNSNADWKRRCSIWPAGMIWLHSTPDLLDC